MRDYRGRAMDADRRWKFGFGFALFGFGVNAILRIAGMPAIGWQPSALTAYALLALSAFTVVVGIYLMLSSAVPVGISFTTLGEYARRNARPVLLWALALLVLAFMTWQSVTIFQLQAARAHRHLSSDQIEAIGRELAFNVPSFSVPIDFADNNAEAHQYALDLATAFEKAHWNYHLTDMSGGPPVMGLCIEVHNIKQIPDSARFLKTTLDRNNVDAFYYEEPAVGPTAYWIFVAPRPD
jgi:hypothetical protein